jgi:hypothetical protein
LSGTASLAAASLGTVQLERGLWWRVYSNAHPAHAFNPSSVGNARFSPLADASGNTIPTMYLAQTPAAALMETVLHDCPSPSSGYILTLPKATEELRRMACLAILQPLVLADFSAIGLRRLGLAKADVVDSEKTRYPQSRDIAQQVYALRPDIQGIQWNARQDDRASAIVLFEPRIKPASLAVWHADQAINDGMVLDELIELLDQLDAGLVLG